MNSTNQLLCSSWYTSCIWSAFIHSCWYLHLQLSLRSPSPTETIFSFRRLRFLIHSRLQCTSTRTLKRGHCQIRVSIHICMHVICRYVCKLCMYCWIYECTYVCVYIEENLYIRRWKLRVLVVSLGGFERCAAGSGGGHQKPMFEI